MPSLTKLAQIPSVAAIAAFTLCSPTEAAAQACPAVPVVTALSTPMGLTPTNLGNLIVSETGSLPAPQGRISIVDPAAGTRWTLIDGLPSGISDVNEPAGPAGVVMRGRTLYVLIGIGDSVVPSPVPGRVLPNPNPSSPIFSSVLAIHFSANVERTTRGFTLSMADQQTLADGGRVVLSNGGGDRIEIELVADFPDYVPDPLPGNPGLVRGSNPFALDISGNELFVTDGGRNLLWRVDLATGDASVLTTFAPIVPNPVGGFGPVLEAVPTGVISTRDGLLVTLFRGAPFPAGTSSVVGVDPVSGAQSTVIGGLRTAIGVATASDGTYVLQHSSGPGLFFGAPGVILRFPAGGGAPEVLADCLTRPTAMWLDERTGTAYVTELGGRLVSLRLW